jgi:hypothetical protein
MFTKENSVTFQFQDMYLLWKFAKKLACKSIKINTRTKILVCDCSVYEMDLATRHHKAIILEKASLASSATACMDI